MISKDEKQVEQKGIVSQNHEEDDVEEDEVVDDTPGAGGEPGEVDLETVVMCYSEETKKKKKKKKPKKKKAQQSDPPRIGLSKIFTNGVYPEGEIQPYKDECVF
jgi:methionyl aminopeptidase